MRLCPKVIKLSLLDSVFFFQKRLPFHIHVALNLKHLSHIYSRPITSLFVDKLAMHVLNPCLFVIPPA